MENVTSIHASRTPKRRHYIPEWAEARNLKRTDIISELGADKSVVYRWFDGNIPSQKWIEPLAALLHTEPASLFRHPDDDWLARFFEQRSESDRQRAREILQAAFPDAKSGTDG